MDTDNEATVGRCDCSVTLMILFILTMSVFGSVTIIV